jgi:peptidoglycan/xylan/chitin deacetylase (PgdA/CDA1 family)
MTNLKLILICLLLVTSQLGVLGQTKILLKLDDIAVNKNTCNAGPVLDYLVQRKIKASYGVIANRLDSTALPVMEKYLRATNANGEKLIEIWHHGLDHSNKNPPDSNREFEGTSYLFQKAHFDSADLLVRTYLGVQMHSFGAPFNATDSNTLKVIAENGHYTSVMYSWVNVAGYPKLTFLNNRVDMEKGTGNPVYDLLVSDFEKHTEYKNSYMVLQGHPPYWNAGHFEAFKKIIDFLVSQKCEFVLPGDLTR